MRACNSLSPDHLSGSERLTEIAEILATGLMRLRAPKSTSLPADCGESSLDFICPQSGAGSPATHVQEDK